MRPRDEEIIAAQERLGCKYGLSRQTAMMLALLVCYPQVTPETVLTRMGSLDPKVIVFKLRARLREADEAVVIHTARSFGYFLDQKTRERLDDRQRGTPYEVSQASGGGRRRGTARYSSRSG